MLYFLPFVPSIICVIGAASLDLHGINGCGWFLFVAYMLMPDVKFLISKTKQPYINGKQ
jgi:hypothetical protein